MSRVRDVTICGGGLAGLTLALQLHREMPDLDIAVVERDPGPLPKACHKVGESSIELGSHYLDTVLGLGDYLAEHHLRKHGLRFFCGPSGQSLVDRLEIGPQDRPPLPSYQLDRGALETHLRVFVERADIEMITDWQVVDIDLAEGDAPHRLMIKKRREESRRCLRSKWVVDATGRLQMLQRKLGLRRPSPVRSCASWFRVAERVRISELVPESEEAWHARDPGGTRWLSTNHLMGLGYWVWLIPLPGGMTSVGIVAETGHHPRRSFDTLERSMAFLAAHEPELFERLRDSQVKDFLTLADYSYSSERVFSKHRWTCVGEAGVFVDPLYSAGTDFIALANTYTTELIKDDQAGRLDAERVDELNGLFVGWAEHAARMLMNNGLTFTHGDVFVTKLWWDFFHYWAFLCQYYFQGIYRLPLEEHRSFSEIAKRYIRLNEWAKSVAEAWSSLRTRSTSSKESVYMPMAPSTLLDLHLDLIVPKTPQETLRRMTEDLHTAEQLVVEMLLRALSSVGDQHARELAERCRLSEWDIVIDPDRIRLHDLPRRARAEGLPRVARDLERTLGHYAPSSLTTLVERARGRV